MDSNILKKGAAGFVHVLDSLECITVTTNSDNTEEL